MYLFSTPGGCKQACAGEHFDAFAPFVEDTVTKGQRLAGFEDVVMHSVPARRADGTVVDASAAIHQLVRKEHTESPFWLLRLVAGTKTAFTTSLPETSALPSRSLTVVDACQTRITPGLVREHLHAGRIVLVTGSKFMQGASFSGAVLVPAPLAKQLRAAGAPLPLPQGMGDYFSSFEIPVELEHWRSQLHSRPNAGLLARWHTALPHIERVGAMEDARRSALEAEWTDGVLGHLAKKQPTLKVAATEKGIISIKCAKGHAFHDTETLKTVYRWLTQDMSSAPGAQDCPAAGRSIYLGQPVQMTKTEAVLRIAMGAELLLQMDDGTYDAAFEAPPVEKLAWAVDRYDEIREWETAQC